MYFLPNSSNLISDHKNFMTIVLREKEVFGENCQLYDLPYKMSQQEVQGIPKYDLYNYAEIMQRFSNFQLNLKININKDFITDLQFSLFKGNLLQTGAEKYLFFANCAYLLLTYPVILPLS